MPLLDYGLGDFIPKTKAKASEMNTKLNAIKTLLNVTKLDAANIQNDSQTAALLHPDVRAILGLNGGGTVHRGKSIVSDEQSRTNTAFGVLGTPDQVSSVSLPNGGLIKIRFRALMKNSVANAGDALVYLNEEPVRGIAAGQFAADAVAGLSMNSTTTWFAVCARSSDFDQDSLAATVAGADAVNAPVVTGAAMAGTGDTPLEVWADPGSYDVSVRYKASSGNITARDRRLYVEAVGF